MNFEIIYRINARSGVLVGATAEILSVGLDKTTVRRRSIAKSLLGKKQAPVIPGSTIKGKLRYECERILKSEGYEVCLAPRADLMCPHNPNVTEQPCVVCRIFGKSGNRIDEPARIFFHDAVADLEDNLTPFATRVQAGVSLSRRRRTSEDDRLYSIERGVEGLNYKGSISGYLPDETVRRQAALLVAALDGLIAIGGGKSRGAGWTSVEILSVTLGGEAMVGNRISSLKGDVKLWRASK